MDERPEPPPEGKLIAKALERSGLSIREASRRAGISYGRWRQITTGYQNVSTGSYARVRAPARTLARMAAVVSVSPGELAEAGREDAAEALRELPAVAPAPGSDDPLGALTPEERRIATAFIRAYREEQANGDERKGA